MTLARAPATEEAVERERFVFQDVDWGFYQTILENVGERNVKVTFDGKDLEIMSPLSEHERFKSVIRRLIELLLEELNIPYVPGGSMTLKLASKRVGLEPDECYYIQNQERIRAPEQPDLGNDPPPDLAVEIDVTSRSVDREPIYAALGVPELWRYEGGRLSALALGPDGRYVPREYSATLPFLRVAELEPFISSGARSDQLTMTRAFREWVRQNLGSHRKE